MHVINEFSQDLLPHIKTKERCQEYGKWFKRQIQKLQKMNPSALFIVIGPADMATKHKTDLITYPLLTDVRDALRQAAFETNSCFWDMYLNMGGENAIQEWAEESPSLAARDYIHFTSAGARKIADMFIANLMEDFNEYELDQSTNE